MSNGRTPRGPGAIPHRRLDSEAYERRARQGPCFVCEMLAGNPEYRAHLVWVDDDALAFLARDPPLLGTTLIAPRAHREQQLAALSWERGMVALPDHDMADLAGRLRARVERMRQGL